MNEIEIRPTENRQFLNVFFLFFLFFFVFFREFIIYLFMFCGVCLKLFCFRTDEQKWRSNLDDDSNTKCWFLNFYFIPGIQPNF